MGVPWVSPGQAVTEIFFRDFRPIFGGFRMGGWVESPGGGGVVCVDGLLKKSGWMGLGPQSTWRSLSELMSRMLIAQPFLRSGQCSLPLPSLSLGSRTSPGQPPPPPSTAIRGYHKPICIVGGVGTIREGHTEKRPISPGACIVVLGGPAMLIGLGGGAASSGQGVQWPPSAIQAWGWPERVPRLQQSVFYNEY